MPHRKALEARGDRRRPQMGIRPLDSEVGQGKGTGALLCFRPLGPCYPPGGSAVASCLVTTSVELSVVTAEQPCLTHDQVLLPPIYMGTFWKVLPRGVKWMWINPDSDCASPQMWTRSLPAPICPGSSTGQPFSRRPPGPADP